VDAISIAVWYEDTMVELLLADFSLERSMEKVGVEEKERERGRPSITEEPDGGRGDGGARWVAADMALVFSVSDGMMVYI
jgi:hypothetical protein